jgi:hypothetical protein
MLDVYDTLNGILQVAAGVMSTLMVSWLEAMLDVYV